VFEQYFQLRKPNGDAIANMALENFVEMMDKVADKRFLLQKEVELELSKRFGQHYCSRYALVTHSLVPYEQCARIGSIQQQILDALVPASMTDASQCDFAHAKSLIESKLVPYLKEHNITQDKFVYSSPYYPKSMPKSKL
jgi:kynurenine 3-monooxygenase